MKNKGMNVGICIGTIITMSTIWSIVFVNELKSMRGIGVGICLGISFGISFSMIFLNIKKNKNKEGFQWKQYT